MNLPSELHSHGLRELCAIEAARGSYEEAQNAIERATGIGLGKRQVEGLACRAAVDVDTFYKAIEREPVEPTDTLVILADGKGIVMRPNALRPATQRAAQTAKNKLKTRLSKGERRNAKRMAELAVVYDCAPVPRMPADVFRHGDNGPKPPSPMARAKWLTGSVVEDARDVISEAFTEAERRDPGHDRQWVALVDGANTRSMPSGRRRSAVVSRSHRRRFRARRRVPLGRGLVFFDEGDPAAEGYVADKGLAVLDGKAGLVAGAIRRKATALGLTTQRRTKADACARYLKNKAPFLDYPTALERGWPIATGVIEGSCRYIVRDRFDITGAR